MHDALAEGLTNTGLDQARSDQIADPRPCHEIR
jgi:hypothetical protein